MDAIRRPFPVNTVLSSAPCTTQFYFTLLGHSARRAHIMGQRPTTLLSRKLDVRKHWNDRAHETTFGGGDAHPNEWQVVAKANRIRES